MCFVSTVNFPVCGCVVITGVEHCKKPTCRTTRVYDDGWLNACPNKYGDCQRLPRSKAKDGKSTQLVKRTDTDSKHEVETESEPAKGSTVPPPSLTISLSECEKAPERTRNTKTGKGSAVSSSTPVAPNHQAPKTGQTGKRPSGKGPAKPRLGPKLGRGSGKWGGMIDEELDLVDMEVDEELDAEVVPEVAPEI